MRYGTLAILGCSGLALVLFLMSDPSPDFYSQQRQSMLEEIRQDTQRTQPFTGISSISEKVMRALGEVERHEFVPDALDYLAYLNRPLPIGQSQTISQPFIVALMTQAVEPQASDKVLEIGTGSGYQAAVLSKLVKEVYTLEIIPALAQEASNRLKQLGYSNVFVFETDGTFGWPDNAPYDKIVVTAASETIPPKLLKQLRSPGVMIIPIGPQNGGQELMLLEKSAEGEITQMSLLPVRFVPFTGAADTPTTP